MPELSCEKGVERPRVAVSYTDWGRKEAVQNTYDEDATSSHGCGQRPYRASLKLA